MAKATFDAAVGEMGMWKKRTEGKEKKRVEDINKRKKRKARGVSK